MSRRDGKGKEEVELSVVREGEREGRKERERTEEEPSSDLDSSDDGVEVEPMVLDSVMQLRRRMMTFPVPVGVSVDVRDVTVAVGTCC